MPQVLYRDALILVLNKPAGIPVHPGPRGAGPSLEDGFAALAFDYHHPPHLAHRLDRDTSGCLVLGRNKKGLRRMGHLFETRQVEKTYWAVVRGAPAHDDGVIDNWLEKVKTPRGWYMKNTRENENAQRAVTQWKVMARANGRAWLELSPQTGRTHQLRVHCLALGCPIVGDGVYGPEEDDPPSLPLHLHARRISFPLHHDAPPVCATAPLPLRGGMLWSMFPGIEE